MCIFLIFILIVFICAVCIFFMMLGIASSMLAVAPHEGMMRPSQFFVSLCHVSSDGLNEERAVTGHCGLQVCAVEMTQTLAVNPWTIPRFPQFPKFDSWKETGLSGHDIHHCQVSPGLGPGSQTQ